MACTYNYKGTQYTQEEYIELLKESNKTLNDEISHIKELLPNAPVNIVNGLLQIPGGFAEGVFDKNMIILSDEAESGTAYHEAFHYVSQLYLSPEGRRKLYDSFKGSVNISDAQVEELLADQFSDYMKGRVSTKLHPVVEYFYNLLQDFLNLFRNEKNKIFNNISRGKYSYKPTSHSESVLYKKSENLKGLSEEWVNDMVQYMSMSMVEYSGIIADASEGVNDLEIISDQIYNDIFDAYEKAKADGNSDIAGHLYIATQEGKFEDLIDLAKKRLSQFKIAEEIKKKESLNEEAKEENLSGDLGLTSSLNISAKNNARAETRMMLTFLQDSSYDSKFFGDYIKAPLDFSKNWNILSKELSGIVSTNEETEGQLMLKKVKSLSKTHPQFKTLYSMLTSDEVLDSTKTKFYSSFSNGRIDYIGGIIQHHKSKAGKDTSIYKQTTGDEQSVSKTLIKEGVSSFIDIYGEKPDLERMTAAAKALHQISKAVDDSFNTNDKEIPNELIDQIIYKTLPSFFNRLGLNISGNAIADYANTKSSDKSIQLKKLMKELSYAIYPKTGHKDFSKLRTTKYDGETLYGSHVKGFDADKNFINNTSIMKNLFKHQATYSDLPGDNSVLGPDGNMYYKETQNSMAVKTLQRFKNGELFDQMLNSRYHRYSELLKKVAKDYEASKNNPNAFSLNLRTFLFNKTEGEAGSEATGKDILSLDEQLDRMNKVLRGSVAKGKSIYTILTMADKSTIHHLAGAGFERFSYNEDNTTAVDKFYNYALAEIERISMSLRDDSVSTIDFYGTKDNNLKSFWFPELSKDGNLAKEINLYNEDGTANTLASAERIKDYIESVLDERIKAEESYISDALRDEDGYIKGIDRDIQNEYRILEGDKLVKDSEDGYTYKDGMSDLISDYALNSIIKNIEFTMLFTGDPAFYKDLSKRTPATIATGYDLILDNIRRKFKVAVGSDIELQSSLYDEYKKYFEDNNLDPDVLAPYDKNEDLGRDGVNQADAQGYITPERFKEIAIGLGKWEKTKHDKIFKALNEGSTDRDYLLEIQKLITEMGVPEGQPLKGMHFELVKDGDVMRPVYLKYSQAVLWPGVIKGTKLVKLASAMKSSKTDEFVFKSGVKVGSKDVSTIDFNNIKLSPFELDNFYWKLQQDLPSKYHKKGRALVGSQPKKNIIANITDRMIGDREGREVAQDVHRIEGMLSDIEKDILDSKWGVRNNKANKDYILKDLIEGFREEDIPENIIEMAEAGVPLDMILQRSTQIDSMLHSKITKAVVKLKSPGGAFVQMSNAGFSKMTGISDLTDLPLDDLNGVIHLKNVDELKGPRKVNGVTVPGDVYLPHSVISDLFEAKPELNDKLKAGTLKGSDVAEYLGDTIENLIGYRIPNQGMSSIDVLNIAGILPPHMGDTIVTYTEITAKTGSDFDIDKMYVMMPHTKYNKKTGLMEVIDMDSDELYFQIHDLKKKLKEGRGEVGNKKLQQAISSKTELLKKALENERIKIWGEILLADATYGDLVTPLDSEFLKDDAYYISFLEEIRKNPGEVSGILDMRIEDVLKSSNRMELSKKYFKNKPVKALEFASPSYQLEVKKRNMAGKAGVGQTANHLTHHALAQEAELYLKYSLGVGNQVSNQDGNLVDLSGTDVEENANTQPKRTITGVISAWLNAYVDNAKDPYISLINNNTKTANTVFLMLRAGVSPEFVNRFISQPLIKEYIETEFESDNNAVDTIFKVGKTNKVVEGVVSSVDSGTETSFQKVTNNSEDTSVADLRSFDIISLEDQILNYDEASPTQISLLNKFLEIQDAANKLNEAVKASKADTEGTYGNSAGNFIARQRKKSVESEGFVGNFSKLFDGTMLGVFHDNSVENAKNVLSGLTILKTPFAEKSVKDIAYITGLNKDGFVTNEKLVNKVYSGLKTYMYGKYAGFDINDATRRVILKRTPEFLMQLKQSHPNNPLVKALTPVQTKEGLKISLRSKVKSGYESDVLSGAWLDLLLHEDPSIKGWAETLIKYSFLTSGFSKGLNTFFDIIPSDYLLKSDMKSHINEFIRGSEVRENTEFVDQFMRNNWDDTSLVPRFKKLEDMGAKIISVKTNAAHGFYIEKDDVSSRMMKNDIMHSYVTYDTGSEIRMYQYMGRQDDRHIYNRVSKLSKSDKGFKEINYGNTLNPLNEDLKTLSLNDLKGSNRINDLRVSKHIHKKDIGTMDIKGDTFTFSDIPGKFNIKGNTLNYNNKPVMDLYSDTQEELIKEAEFSLRSIGLDIIQTYINNNC